MEWLMLCLSQPGIGTLDFQIEGQVFKEKHALLAEAIIITANQARRQCYRNTFRNTMSVCGNFTNIREYPVYLTDH